MIQIKNVSKSFGDKQILKSLDAKFYPGYNVLMGASGSGKTTLTNMILGLCVPDSGEITGIHNKTCSCCFQENRLIESLSAVKNVMLVCEKKMKSEVIKLLTEMGLRSDINKPVSTLSGGMRNRVAIARAIINPADIYIFDEAFKGLDDKLKTEIIKITKNRVNKDAVSIFITHDSKEVKLLEIPNTSFVCLNTPRQESPTT